MNNTTENKTVNKKICGLKLPQEVNDYIRNRAKTENRSLANVIAMIVMEYFSKKTGTISAKTETGGKLR